MVYSILKMVFTGIFVCAKPISITLFSGEGILKQHLKLGFTNS